MPDRRFIISSILSLIAIALAFGAIILIFGWDWTGFRQYVSPPIGADQEYFRGKTLWDFLELLVIPTILAGGALFFNQQVRENEQGINQQARQHEQEIAEDRNREISLQNYLDKMTELLLDKDLRTTEESEVRSVARSRTLTTLRTLDGIRKGLLLRFLYESKLLDRENPIISLEEADLSEAYLFGDILSRADLSGAHLWGAHLTGAYLSEASLSTASLSRADLRWANLSGADLTEADLSGANLSGANLTEANLTEADLSGANLSGAEYNENTHWPEGFDPDAASAIGS
jgi:uncharacterized protein YjbI with pentapeptide repeats